MIPENDPFVESEDDSPSDPEAIVKRLFADLNSPFDPSVTFFTDRDGALMGGTNTTTTGEREPIELHKMMEMINSAHKVEADNDMKLIKALMSLGALISIQQPIHAYSDNGPIIVSLPPRFQRALDRIKAQQKEMEERCRGMVALPPARYIYPLDTRS